MKKIVLLLVALCITFSIAYGKQIKLLTIGNSFSDDAVEHYLYGLAEASGDTIIIGNMVIGGCPLEKHYNNSVSNAANYSYRKIVAGEKTVTLNFRLEEVMKDEPWDYISFQQASPLSGQYNTYTPYLTELIKYVRQHTINPNVEIIFHITWAYAQNSTHEGFANYGKDQLSMYNAILSTAKKALEDNNIRIFVPAGTAIQNGRTSSLGDTFCRDGYHLELNYGRYTASCTWYETLFNKSVVGNTYIPPKITPEQARIAQLAAHHAVKEPWKITPIE
jgi:hypothetical protein